MQTKINWYYYARKQSVTCTDAIGRITVLFDVRIIFMKVLNGARDLVLEIILTCLVRLFNVVKSSIRAIFIESIFIEKAFKENYLCFIP